MKKNVLVFPCGSEIALEVHRSLIHSTHFNVIGANSVDDHGKFVFEQYIGGVPFATDINFIPTIKQIVKDYNIDFIYPAMDRVITILKNAEDEIGCKVIGSEAYTTDVCMSKRKTYESLNGIVRTPKVYDVDDHIDFPVFVKPDVGYGARGAVKVDNRESLNQYLLNSPDAVISELLTGEEYTIDCFTDRRGVVKFWAPRCRSRVSNGISVNTYPIERSDEFREFVERINANIKFRGAWFIQVKRNKFGELTLLEIASRFGGSSALFRAKGVNFTLLSLFDALEYDVEIYENTYGIEMDRALETKFRLDVNYNEVYIDFDDCIIINGKYFNLDAIRFIYQCKNNGVRVVLLSRHSGNLQQRVANLGISLLFDEVIHITNQHLKSSYIKNPNSIFIDDSFAERKDVATNCGINVFSVDMIPVLMN